MAFFGADVHALAAGSPFSSGVGALSSPAAELASLLTSLLSHQQRDVAAAAQVVQPVCATIQAVWSQRRPECEQAVIHLCWQAHLFQARGSASASGGPAEGGPQDPFKILATILTHLESTHVASMPPASPAYDAFLSLLETILLSSRVMQVLALGDSSLIWSLFALTECAEVLRRRAAIRLTVALICAAAATTVEILPALAVPPSLAGSPTQTSSSAPAPQSSRARAVVTAGSISGARSPSPPPLYSPEDAQRVSRVLLTKYVELLPAHCTPSLDVLCDLIHGLHALLCGPYAKAHQDLCRRRQVFVQLMHILSHLGHGRPEHEPETGTETEQRQPQLETTASFSTCGDDDTERAAEVGSLDEYQEGLNVKPLRIALSNATEDASLSHVRTHSSPSAAVHAISPTPASGGGLNMPSLVRGVSDPLSSTPQARSSPSLSLLLSLLRCLTLLLAGNARSKEVFRKNIGQDLLASLVHNVLKREMTRKQGVASFSATAGEVAARAIYGELFRSLCEREWCDLLAFERGTGSMGVEEATPATSDSVSIQNGDVILLIFSPALFLLAPPSVQRDVLHVFTRLVSSDDTCGGGNALNQSHASKVLLVDLLLDLFPLLPPLAGGDESSSLQRGILELMQQIGTHSISVKQLKRVFALMKSSPLPVPQEWLRAPYASAAATQQALAAAVEPAQSPVTPATETSTDAPAPSLSRESSLATARIGAPSAQLVEVQVRPWFGPLLLSAISAMTRKSGPENYWALDGLTSGLTIPPLERWPAKGWAFSAWVRLEGYEQPRVPQAVTSDASLGPMQDEDLGAPSTPTGGPRPSYQPRLFHFSCGSGGPCVEAFFSPSRRLVVSISLGGGAVQQASIDYELSAGQWYHIALSQSAATFFSRSELVVHVDGACVHTSSLKYPAIAKQMSFCFVGTDQAASPSALTPPVSASATPSTSIAQALHGQLGPFYLFDEVISPAQIALMHALGPSYMFTFGPETMADLWQAPPSNQDTLAVALANASGGHGRRVSATAPSGQSAGGGLGVHQQSAASIASLTSHARSLAGKIFLAYNAKARDGHLFLDNTPRSKRQGTARGKRGMHAVALAGTHQCSTRHVSHVLACLGGVNVLFPLLAQLDQPVLRTRSTVQEHTRFDSEDTHMPLSTSTPSSPDPRLRRVRLPSSGAVSPVAEGAGGSPAIARRGSGIVVSPGGAPFSTRGGLSSNRSELVYSVDRRFLPNFLHLLCVMLSQGSTAQASQAYMLNIHGFSVLASQLELASPRHFTMEAVAALQTLVLSVRSHPLLFKHAFVAFFTNCALFIHVEPAVQQAWLNVLQRMVHDDPTLMNPSLALGTINSASSLMGKGTQHLLDRLRSVCWFERPEGSSSAAAAPRTLLHPVTQQVIGARPQTHELVAIRASLLEALYATLSRPPLGVALADIRAIVLFLQAKGGSAAAAASAAMFGAGVGVPTWSEHDAAEARQVEDVLWLLVRLLEKQSVLVLKYLSEMADTTQLPSLPAATAPDTPAASLEPGSSSPTLSASSGSPALLAAKHAATTLKYQNDSHGSKRAGLDIFLSLLYSGSSTRVRALALRGLAKLMRSGTIPSVAQDEMFLVVEHALCGGLDGGRMAASDTNVTATGVCRREWDESIYLALLSLMLGVHIDASNIREVRTTLLLEGTTILHIAALCTLFKLCAFHSSSCSAGPPLMEIILQDMMFLLNHATINIKLVVEQHGWQEWLTQIIVTATAEAQALGAQMSEFRSSPVESKRPSMLGSLETPVQGVEGSTSSSTVAPTPRRVYAAASVRTPSPASTSALAGVSADSSAIFPSAPAPVVVLTGDEFPAPLTIPLSPSPSTELSAAAAAVAEQVQSSINAASYATSLCEQLFVHALKKPGGWRHFDRLVGYLAFQLPPATLASDSTGGSVASSATVVLPRMNLSVLGLLVSLLADLCALLRREAETTPALELGLLVDNVLRVLDRAQDAMLERVSMHARAGAADPTSEIASVWPLVEVLLVLRGWCGLHSLAHSAWRAREREKDQSRRGVMSLLGSVGSGRATWTATATRAIMGSPIDPFDMVSEPNVTTPSGTAPVAPTAPSEREPQQTHEPVYLCQILLRLCACCATTEEEKDSEVNPNSQRAILQLLFAGPAGKRACEIFAFLMSAERASAAAAASAAGSVEVGRMWPRSSGPSPVSRPPGASPGPSPAATPTGAWGSPLSSPSASSPSLVGSLHDTTEPHADLLLHLYTLLAALWDELVMGATSSVAEGAEPGAEHGSHPSLTLEIDTEDNNQACEFVALVARAAAQLHAISAACLRTTEVGSSHVVNAAASTASTDNIGHARAHTLGATPSAPSLSVSLTQFTLAPATANPSAARLPVLPSLDSLDPASSSTPLVLQQPEWISAMLAVRPLVHSLGHSEGHALEHRIRSIKRLCGARTSEAHSRLVTTDAVTFTDALVLSSSLAARHASAEAARFESMHVKRARAARRRQSTWKWIMRSLTNERGPWAPTPAAASAEGVAITAPRKVYWKLDDTESSTRMRRKLKLNYRGHAHKEAAHDSVKQPIRVKAKRSTPSMGSGTQQPGDEGASATPSTDAVDEDLFAQAVRFSKSAMGVLSPECRRILQATEPEDDWEQLGGKGAPAIKAATEDRRARAAATAAAVGVAQVAPTTAIVFDAECSVLRTTQIVGGRLRASATHLHFEPREEPPDSAAAPGSPAERERERKRKLARRRGGSGVLETVMSERTWLLSHVVALHFRRHQLRRNGLELFFQDHTCVFIVFPSEAARNTAHTKLLRALRPFARTQQSRLVAATGTSAGGVVSPLAHMGFMYAGSSGNYGVGGPWGGNAFDVIRKSGLVAAWRARKISNFEYLMHLNTCILSSTLVATADGRNLRADELKADMLLLTPSGDPLPIKSIEGGYSPIMIRIATHHGQHVVTPNHQVTLRWSRSPSVYMESRHEGATEVVVEWWDRVSLEQRQKRWRLTSTASADEVPRSRSSMPLAAESVVDLPDRLVEQSREFARWWLQCREEAGLECPLRRGDLFEVSADRLLSHLSAQPRFMEYASLPMVRLAHPRVPSLAGEVPCDDAVPASSNDEGWPRWDVRVDGEFVGPSGDFTPAVMHPETDNDIDQLADRFFAETQPFSVRSPLRMVLQPQASLNIKSDQIWATATTVAHANAIAKAGLAASPTSLHPLQSAFDEVLAMTSGERVRCRRVSKLEPQSAVPTYQYTPLRSNDALGGDVVYLLQQSASTFPHLGKKAYMHLQLEHAWQTLDIDPGASKVLLTELDSTTNLDSSDKLSTSIAYAAMFASDTPPSVIVVFGSAKGWETSVRTMPGVLAVSTVTVDPETEAHTCVMSTARGPIQIVFSPLPSAPGMFTDLLAALCSAHGRYIDKRMLEQADRTHAPITCVELAPAGHFTAIEVDSEDRRFVLSDMTVTHNCSGRTYNDLTQYPVFPWVIADYESATINLDDPTNASGVFRDLRKPMGALNANRLRMFQERYHSLDDPDMPKFMYGTHYSSSQSVLHYLMRLEPFMTAGVELQDGKFDHSDRLFHSIPATWTGVTSNAADVKELIPEFFYLPEMFVNGSGIDFGRKQHGEPIDDVILPPWAQGSATEFVRINRAALESEYVSMHLHLWIDLIFGFAQQGRAALEANNVFFHLTYEGAVDIDRIEDPVQRASVQQQIEHFGQTPSQLFTTPHPQRCSLQEKIDQEIPNVFQQLRDAEAGGASSLRGMLLQLYTVEQVTAPAATDNPLLYLALLPGTDRLLSIGLDRVMALHKFRNIIQLAIPPFILEVEKPRKRGGAATWAPSSSSSSGGGGINLAGALSFMGGGKNNLGSGRRVGVHFTVGLALLPFFFLVSRDERYLVSCGHWDNSFRVTSIGGGGGGGSGSGGAEAGAGVQAISAHKDIVTCVAVSEVGDYVVTGSKDTTTRVWQVVDAIVDLPSHPRFASMGAEGPAAASAAAAAAAAGELYLFDTPLHVLYGHDDEVSVCAVSSDLDTVISASRDGTIMLHALRSGRYTRTITPGISAMPSLLHEAPRNSGPSMVDHSASAAATTGGSGGAVRWVGISTLGVICSYSLVDLALRAFTLNGESLGSADTGERLYALTFSRDGEYLLAGGDRKQLSVYSLRGGDGLHCVYRLPPVDATIRSIALTQEEQHVLVGTSTGKLYVYSLNAEVLKRRVLNRLAIMGLL